MTEFLIKWLLGDAQGFTEALISHPITTSFKVLAILALVTIAYIAASWLIRFFGPKSKNNTNTISYGQGGAGGAGGGQGGAGGNVTNVHGFPFQVGTYQIKVGNGGAPGQKGEASSITTPSGEIIIVSGGEGGKTNSS